MDVYPPAAASTPAVIGRGVADAIRAASVAARPQEACGLLFADAAGVIVAASVACNVAAARRTRFEIDPAHLFAAQRGVRGSGLTVAGCWHSHPDGAARPSQYDADGVSDRGWLWLIEARGVIGAFLPVAAGFRAQTLIEMDVAVVAPPLAAR